MLDRSLAILQRLNSAGGLAADKHDLLARVEAAVPRPPRQ
jgi:hypothetical protein